MRRVRLPTAALARRCSPRRCAMARTTLSVKRGWASVARCGRRATWLRRGARATRRPAWSARCSSCACSARPARRPSHAGGSGGASDGAAGRAPVLPLPAPGLSQSALRKGVPELVGHQRHLARGGAPGRARAAQSRRAACLRGARDTAARWGGARLGARQTDSDAAAADLRAQLAAATQRADAAGAGVAGCAERPSAVVRVPAPSACRPLPAAPHSARRAVQPAHAWAACRAMRTHAAVAPSAGRAHVCAARAAAGSSRGVQLARPAPQLCAPRGRRALDQVAAAEAALAAVRGGLYAVGAALGGAARDPPAAEKT